MLSYAGNLADNFGGQIIKIRQPVQKLWQYIFRSALAAKNHTLGWRAVV